MVESYSASPETCYTVNNQFEEKGTWREHFQHKPLIEAVERIESYINGNILPPTTGFQASGDLCEMWEMNRTTLRSAIRSLIDEGKLYNKVGSGTFVSEPKLTRNLQDMQSPYETGGKLWEKAAQQSALDPRHGV